MESLFYFTKQTVDLAGIRTIMENLGYSSRVLEKYPDTLNVYYRSNEGDLEFWQWIQMSKWGEDIP